MEKPDSNNPNDPSKTEADRPVRVGPDGKLHHLMSQIERLKHLCAEGFRKVDKTKTSENIAPDQPPDQTFTHYPELGELILRSLDGDITPEDFGQLEKWITEYPEALQYYLDYVHLCVDLRISHKQDLWIKDLQVAH